MESSRDWKRENQGDKNKRRREKREREKEKRREEAKERRKKKKPKNKRTIEVKKVGDLGWEREISEVGGRGHEISSSKVL